MARTGGMTADTALAWVHTQLPKIESIGPHWIDEIQGLANGAAISFNEALALQIRPGTDGLSEGCTSFAAVGSTTVNCSNLAGQNRDLGESYLHRMFVSVLRPDNRPDILMHSVPGELGGTGINGCGVAIFANSLWAKSGRTWMAPPVLRRAVLESTSADTAVKQIQTMNGPAVGNFLIADTNCAFNLEILPEGTVVTKIDDGVYAHANNCIAEELAPHEAVRRPLPFSESRRQALQKALEQQADAIDVSICQALLSDESGRPEPICRRVRLDDPFATVAGLIGHPDTRSLHISYGPPSDGNFATYVL